MATERRPRIPAELAEQIDGLRDGEPFESYLREVLERHVASRKQVPVEHFERERGARRLFEHFDHGDTALYVDRPLGDRDPRALLHLTVDDENFDPVQVDLDEPAVRVIRDICTETLGQYDSQPQ